MQGYVSNTMTSNPEEIVQLEIFVSARALKDLDIFSKSDPYVKVHFKKAPNQPWTCIGKTQTVDNCLNPNFQKTFVVDYFFETRQQLKFQVFDQDDKANSGNDDFIGSLSTTLGALAGAKDQTSILNLTANNQNISTGKLIVRVQPFSAGKSFLKMKWRAQKLINTDSWFDWWDKSDPYLKFLKIRKDNTFIEAGRTEVVMKNLNPSWRDIDLSISRLVREDNPQQKFKIECWDWQQEGEPKHQFIGQVYLTLPSLLKQKPPLQIPLLNPKKKKPGFLVLQRLMVYQKPSFIEYLRGGLQLNLSVAIDFTGSNGVPTFPTSLHYLNPTKPNQYQTAIMAVGSILLDYDYDKMIPAFGFGAKPKFNHYGGSGVSHCFPLSGRDDIVQAAGLDGLMNFYSNAIVNVELSGPTYFSPLLQRFIQIAQRSMKESSQLYQVLLILTDGQIHDMEKTVDLIVGNSNLPLSIIIVGIGSADFTNMSILDGDNGLYDSKGRKASRDIVQFVPFNQVAGNPDMLAKQLLAELPEQVVQYMGLMGIPPSKPANISLQNILVGQEGDIEKGLKQNLPKLFENLATLNKRNQ